MPFFIPFAVGGLVLTALGLGVRKVLTETGVTPPEDARLAQAREGHRAAVAALRADRLQVRDGVATYGALQARVHAEVVVPFGALLERLERWGYVREAELLGAEALEALRALPREAPSRATRRGWPLLGAGVEVPAALEPVLAWLDRGWLDEESPPVVLDGTSLYAALSARGILAGSAPEEGARALDEASGLLGRTAAFLGALRTRLTALEERVAGLHGRASAQLAYLDAASFEEGGEEPRERLTRLAVLVGQLAMLLRTPVLSAEGRLTPLLAARAEDDVPSSD
ncbi:hypothetical protein HV824_03920 [Myxococcus sp. AM009]|uniref:hypothetical protein n=1 Tax=unclassified Myxococcus TaxID=2648731 RepID=UPI001595294C|nr:MULTISPECIES: hypothetical protein [unclassified Myxococcus]NVI97265.1 hypothetical protein [Myxococcus sp. AM009]NVJ13561.1 hypothetical protein [Myxococcus sp. AM010]